MRIAVGEFGQLHLLNEMEGAFIGLAACEFAAGCQRESNVLFDGFPGQKLIEFLKNEDAIRPGRNDLHAIERDAAFHWADVSTNGFQDRRLAATGGSENDESIRLQDIETNPPR